jgi:16S rRNA (cytidine1402-2'-O)-methyltransferase
VPSSASNAPTPSPGNADAQPNGAPEASKPTRSNPAERLPAGLYLVATPIGNAADITLRALDTLRRADLLACEDTRMTRKLLGMHSIDRPSSSLLPYHDHNAAGMRPRLLAHIASGRSIALVTDAGSPCVSDPGYKLVAAATEAGHTVTTLPGPTAAIVALQLSALPTDRFMFAGFPPPKSGARQRFLSELAAVPATLVFYEGPSRVAACLADMAKNLGNRKAAVARELTKLFEEVKRGSLEELAHFYAETGAPRGEVAIVVAPPEEQVTSDDDLDALLLRALKDQSIKDAVAGVAAATGRRKREVYSRALELSGGPD